MVDPVYRQVTKRRMDEEDEECCPTKRLCVDLVERALEDARRKYDPLGNLTLGELDRMIEEQEERLNLARIRLLRERKNCMSFAGGCGAA